MGFARITDTSSFQNLIERSNQVPVVIFKHSLTCPISATAYDQMSQFEGDIALVEVQRARELSNEIEDKLNVPHESPQVIVLHNGQVAWNASHFKITTEAVLTAVRSAKQTERAQGATDYHGSD